MTKDFHSPELQKKKKRRLRRERLLRNVGMYRNGDHLHRIRQPYYVILFGKIRLAPRRNDILI